jgi:ubiquinone biosynthesis protein COQ4
MAETVRTDYRLHPLVAWRALRKLVRDRDDTRQVFLITDALRGKSALRGMHRFRRTPPGAAILAEKRSLLERLCDRPALAALPPGTLGRTYHEFLAEENLSAEGLVEASKIGPRSPVDEDEALYRRRLREMHDLWHVLTGYGRDPLGEVCVVAFSFAQTGNLGFAAISLIGMTNIARSLKDQPIRRAVLEAWRNGRRAAWLPGEDWENLLGEKVEALRQRLRIVPPRRYQQICEKLQQPALAAAMPVRNELVA